MKKAFLVSALVLLGLASVFSLDPAELNNVVVFNNSGALIEYLFLSPGDSEYWGPDILGSTRTLDNRDSLGFFIHYPEECNSFDFMALDENGDAYIVWDVEICDGEEAEITISKKNLSDDPPNFDYVALEIINTSSFDMWYVFLSPSDSSMWGIDLLDEDTILEVDDSVEFLIPIGDEEVDYDFLGVDEDEDDYQFTVTIDPYEGDELYIEVTDDDLML